MREEREEREKEGERCRQRETCYKKSGGAGAGARRVGKRRAWAGARRVGKRRAWAGARTRTRGIGNP